MGFVAHRLARKLFKGWIRGIITAINNSQLFFIYCMFLKWVFCFLFCKDWILCYSCVKSFMHGGVKRSWEKVASHLIDQNIVQCNYTWLCTYMSLFMLLHRLYFLFVKWQNIKFKFPLWGNLWSKLNRHAEEAFIKYSQISVEVCKVEPF